MRSKLILTVALSLVAALGLSAAALAADAPAPEKPPVIGVGGEVKDFTLAKIDGTHVNFAKDIKGKAKTTAISFSNTACATCLSETRVLNDIAKEAKGDLAVFTVMVDARGADAARAFKEQYNLTNIVYLLDKDFTQPPLYGYNYTPALILVDKGGKIVYSKGGFDSSQLKTFVQEIKSFIK